MYTVPSIHVVRGTVKKKYESPQIFEYVLPYRERERERYIYIYSGADICGTNHDNKMQILLQPRQEKRNDFRFHSSS